MSERVAIAPPSLAKLLLMTNQAIVAWQEIPRAVASAADELRALVGGPSLESEQAAQSLLTEWLPDYEKEDLSWAEIRRLRSGVTEKEVWLSKSQGTEKASNAIHALSNSTVSFQFRPLAAAASLRNAADEESAATLRSQMLAISTRLIRELPCRELLRDLAVLLRLMPSVREAVPSATVDGNVFRRIVIVEDDQAWAARFEGAVRKVIRSTGSSTKPDITIVTNSVDALRHLESRDELTFPLVLLDLSIPAVPETSSNASPEEGLRLLSRLRTYGVKAAVVVITAPWYDLGIHQRIVDAQVPEEWIIYKIGKDVDEQLETKLGRLIRQLDRQITLRIQEAPRYSAIIDGVRIALTPGQHKLLSTMADLSRGRSPSQAWLKTRTILDAIGRNVSAQEEEDLSAAESSLEDHLLNFPGSAWARAPQDMREPVLNVGRSWATAFKQCPGDVGLAFRKFKAQAPHTVKRQLEQVYNWLRLRTTPRLADWQTLNDIQRADWLASHFGLATADSQASREDRLGWRIGELRTAIFTELAKVPRYCHPQAVVEKRMVATDDKAEYRIPCKIENDYHRAVQRPLRVLVVEDDDNHRETIRRTLADNGHEVSQRTNKDDAIRLAIIASQKGEPFDVVSLDLHIPADSITYSRGPYFREKSNGVDVLRRIVEAGIEAKVVVPTTLSNDDELRQSLVEFGVRVCDFVPKSGPNWEIALLTSIERFGRERLEGAVIPQAGGRLLPVISILFSEDGKLRVEVNDRRPSLLLSRRQARFLRTLLLSANQFVSYDTLVPAVYGRRFSQGTDENRLKQLKKNVQAKLVSFGAIELELASEVGIIDNSRGQGYILHCVVKGTLAPAKPAKQMEHSAGSQRTVKDLPARLRR